MIPPKTIEELIIKHSNLEKDLSSSDLNKNEFAEKCLNQAGVALIQGTAFGKFSLDNVRMNFTTSEENISQALENIKKMLS